MTTPRFETGDERYAWLNGLVCVGEGRRTAQGLSYRIYAVANAQQRCAMLATPAAGRVSTRAGATRRSAARDTPACILHAVPVGHVGDLAADAGRRRWGARPHESERAGGEVDGQGQQGGVEQERHHAVRRDGAADLLARDA